MASPSKKLLLIGATGFERNKEGLRLDCVAWNQLRKLKNVQDYDKVIVNVLGLRTEKDRENIDWQCFRELFDFSATAAILEPEGLIVILGDPRFELPPHPTRGERQPFLYWTGLSLNWDNQPGDTVKYNSYGNEEFAAYAKHLRAWRYSLAGCSLDRKALETKWNLQAAEDSGIRPSIDVDHVCVNRYGNALAFRVWHRMRDKYDQRGVRFGPIYFLPEIDLDEEETLNLVLRDFCDAAGELPEPVWLSSFEAPGQRASNAKIARIEAEMVNLTATLEEARLERARARLCLKLLYEREFGLEPVVREILRALGANVKDPVEKNKEDGWVTVQVGPTVYEGVLEIKSTKNDQFGEDGRKQLLDWIDRGRTLHHKTYKGIFIGNSAVTTPVDKRPDAFSDSWKKAAALSQICAIKSENLFLAYVLDQGGRLNRDEFWQRLFVTDGVFDIGPFLPKKTTAD